MKLKNGKNTEGAGVKRVKMAFLESVVHMLIRNNYTASGEDMRIVCNDKLVKNFATWLCCYEDAKINVCKSDIVEFFGKICNLVSLIL
jgi:hypothetical protein